MKIKRTIVLSILIFSSSFAQDAKEIVRKSDELIKSNSSYAEVL